MLKGIHEMAPLHSIKEMTKRDHSYSRRSADGDARYLGREEHDAEKW